MRIFNAKQGIAKTLPEYQKVAFAGIDAPLFESNQFVQQVFMENFAK